MGLMIMILVKLSLKLFNGVVLGTLKEEEKSARVWDFLIALIFLGTKLK